MQKYMDIHIFYMQALAPLKYTPFCFKETTVWCIWVYLKCRVVQSREDAVNKHPQEDEAQLESVRVHERHGQGEHLPE